MKMQVILREQDARLRTDMGAWIEYNIPLVNTNVGYNPVLPPLVAKEG